MDLSLFNTTSLYEAATDLFSQLNIQLNSNTTGSLPAREILKEHYRNTEIYNAIRNTYFIGIVDESIFREVGLFDERYSIKQALVQAERNYDGLMLFALELDKHPTRTEISDLTRSFNRISQKMPVGLLLKYDNDGEAVISIAISERFKYKQNWRQGEKAGKVIILRDIHTKTTHAGHIRILKDLTKPVAVTSYAQLHAHWLEVLDVSILNKRFFQELANWYFWAMDNVSFPDDVEKDKELRNATNLIRLITRIIFIWFIKEKKLVPNNLFRKESLKNIVVDFMKNNKSENFYHAILQNLFFGTLNQVIEERGFVKEGTFQENRAEYGVKNLFRYVDKFLISESDVIELFREIPFLNGGLFDCLDKPDDEGKITYVDGFSRNPKKQSHIPDYIFFTTENEVDLNEIYGTRNKRYKVQGLINLLESYKFTVAENTPIEEEIALDPELLGKVFENLLASYNPETKTTARKQTGSFYTPREIVNFMVDESLIEYLTTECNNSSSGFVDSLRKLFSYEMEANPFSKNDTKVIIRSLNNCKILDPACGSGAFPMGILHKMVHLLNVLDTNNTYWKELQMEKVLSDTKTAYEIEDHEERKRRIDEIEDVFENNTNDYGRKLYLIENCIYGIDIQPIAVQIAKLRFFISLIIDQNKREAYENYGIRSLPNLETKFVAANTLISLDKPQLKTGDIFLNETFQEINKLSNQLKEIRHKYFNAKIRNEKLKFQKIDKELRKEISNHLVKVGHTSINAHKIASFDPYDQNHFADWFEQEWMFGKDVCQGFNIVIGNPPYLIIPKSVFQEKYSKYYSLQEGKPDLYRLFIEKSFSLVSPSGTLSFITPNTFLTIPSAERIRKYLVNNLTIVSIVNYDQTVFESASVNSIVFLVSFKKPDKNAEFLAANLIKTQQLNESSFIVINQLKSNANSKYEINIFADEKVDKLLMKLVNNSNKLNEIRGISMSLGLQPYHNTMHSESQIKNRFLHSAYKINKNYIIELGGRDVNKYIVSISNDNYLDFSADLYTKPSIDFFTGERLIIREIVSDTLIVALTNEKLLFNKSCYIVKSANKEVNNVYLLALLNSKLIGFFIRNTGDKSKQTLFPRITMRTLKSLPIMVIDLNEQKEVHSITHKISEIKNSNLKSDTSGLEQQLNNMIYGIYNLTDEEIKLIESN